jgi:hypothetical protein
MRDILTSSAPNERRRGVAFVLLMSFAGLASGVITVALCDGPYYQALYRTDGLINLGIPFGAAMASCLVITGVTRAIWRLLCLLALVPCVLIISVSSAEMVDFLFAGRERYHPTSLFVGGTIGGLIILVGALILFQPKIGFRAIALHTLTWAVLPGVLSPIAWVLGPSLCMWVWSALHRLGLTSPTEAFLHVLNGETVYGPPNRLFALFVVWQTGMGLVLGMTLRNARQKRETSSLEELKLT